MGFGKFRSQLYSLGSKAKGLTRLFSGNVKTGKYYQSSGVASKLSFDVLRCFGRCRSLSAQVKIQGNLIDDSGKQLLGSIDRSIGDRRHELFHTGHAVAGL